MLASDLDFALPPDLIAQTPLEPRDAARLLVLQRASGEIQDRAIRDLPEILRPDDLLIFNDTRVLRARLHGHKTTGGRIEALLLKERAPNVWECLLKNPGKIGSSIEFEKDGKTLRAEIKERGGDGWTLQFEMREGENVRDVLPQLGEVPLPPYIRQTASETRYQTVFARESPSEKPLDSAAAPTAGLHFTPELLANLRSRGIQTAFLTLAVGAGTFRPVQSERLDEHPMHAEEFWIPEATVQAIAYQRAHHRRVVAVGTTVTRALESVSDENGQVREGAGETAIFIRPGYHFRCIDALLTNFHLPRSTLLALVAAFAGMGGLEKIRYAYKHAIAENYRFFSFGDAMLIE